MSVRRILAIAVLAAVALAAVPAIGSAQLRRASKPNGRRLPELVRHDGKSIPVSWRGNGPGIAASLAAMRHVVEREPNVVAKVVSVIGLSRSRSPARRLTPRTIIVRCTNQALWDATCDVDAPLPYGVPPAGIRIRLTDAAASRRCQRLQQSVPTCRNHPIRSAYSTLPGPAVPVLRTLAPTRDRRETVTYAGPP